MGGKPSVPGWVRWLMDRLMTPAERREALAELDDLHATWEARLGRPEADRRYLREARRYPAALLIRGLGDALRPPEVRGVINAGARCLRSLLRAPVLTSSIVLTVGVGIAGCTALFAVADVLFLRPLPYAGAERLTWIYTHSPPYRFNFSVADFQALEEQQTSFERVAAFQTLSRTFVAGDVVERLSVWETTTAFFDVLGVAPVVGRTATREEGLLDAPVTALVTADFATTRLGASDSELGRVIGSTILLDDAPVEVIGVLPARFGPLGSRTEVFVTARLEPPTRRGPFFQIVLGRLASGVDPEAARDELSAINRRVFPLWRASYQDESATWAMAPLGELLHGDVDRLVLLLGGTVGLLLLLATANAGTLLLSRVHSRARELSVRVALGASRARVVGHLLAEGLILAGAGAVVAALLARGALALMPVVAATYIPRLGEVELSARAMAFAALLATLAGLFFGLVSALHGSPQDAAGSLSSAGRSVTPGRRAQRSQRILVAAQIAIAVPLLLGAGLLGTSLRNLRGADVGFEPRGLLTARVSLAAGRYASSSDLQEFWWSLEDRVARLPGVLATGVSDGRPPVEAFNYNNFDLEDAPTPPGEAQPVANWVSADAGYLAALGIPLVEGRMLTREDETPDAQPAIVVDERWVRRHFPGQSAVGRRLREGGATTGEWTTVVGVVGEVPYAGVAGETGGTVYAPWTGLAEPFIVARVGGEPAELVASLREELRRLDPTAPLTDIETGESLLGASFVQPSHLTLLLGMFASLAALLAVIGLYGVTAHAAQSRRGDIAVRLALGGTPGRVLGAVVRNGVVLSLLGLVAGAASAPAFTRLMSGVLYGIEPGNPVMLLAVVGLLAAVSLAACAVPAWQVVRVDPGTTLRAG
jgi:predicted permease